MESWFDAWKLIRGLEGRFEAQRADLKPGGLSRGWKGTFEVWGADLRSGGWTWGLEGKHEAQGADLKPYEVNWGLGRLIWIWMRAISGISKHARHCSIPDINWDAPTILATFNNKNKSALIRNLLTRESLEIKCHQTSTGNGLNDPQLCVRSNAWDPILSII